MARMALKRKSRHLKDYLLVVQEHELLGEQDLRTYLGLARSGSEAARRALVEGSLAWVVRWSAPLRGGRADFLKLIEAGNLALLHALEPGVLDEASDLLPQIQARVEEAVAERALGPRP